MTKTAQKPLDEKDIEINKLKGANRRLQNKIKDLNITVEKTIAKANELSQSKKKAEHGASSVVKNEQDGEKLMQIRLKEIENTEKLIKNNQRELDLLKRKLEDYKATDEVARLTLELGEHRKTEIDLRQEVTTLEIEHKE